MIGKDKFIDEWCMTAIRHVIPRIRARLIHTLPEGVGLDGDYFDKALEILIQEMKHIGSNLEKSDGGRK